MHGSTSDGSRFFQRRSLIQPLIFYPAQQRRFRERPSVSFLIFVCITVPSGFRQPDSPAEAG
jgi:hypothetical protein